MNFKPTIFTFFALLLATGWAAAQNDDFRKNPPKAGPAPRIQMGEYEQFSLDNGLQVIVVENHKLPKVTFQLLVDVPPATYGEKAGVPDLAGDLLSRGTASRAKAEIDQAVDFIGASLYSTSTGVYASSLSKHKATLLELMADVALNPAFPEEEFEKVLQQQISGLQYQASDPATISSNVSQVLRNGSAHPYGELTTEETLGNIKLADCKAYYEANFKPNISYLAFIGDITAEEARELAEQYFGKWEKGAIAKKFFPRPDMPEEAQVAFVNKDGATQSVLNITYPVNLKPGAQDAIVANVLNTLLGGGVLSSRLNQNIREDKGYSYGVRSTLSYDKLIGYFAAGGNVRNEVTDSAVVEMLKEMELLRNELVTEKELQGVKNFIFGSFARSTERPETAARFALNTARYKLPKDYYATYLEKVAAVTREDLREAARKFLRPDQAYIVVVGNMDETAEALQRVAPVVFYDKEGQEKKAAQAAIPEGLTGMDVINSYLEALGGKDALAKVEDVTISMSATVQGMQLSIETKQAASGKMAMAVKMNGNVMNETRFDGEKGMVSAMGQKQILEGEEAEAMKARASIFPELNYSAKDHKIDLTGVEEINGEQAYKLQITLPSGDVVTEYYAVASGLKLRQVTKQEGPTGEISVTNEFADYQAVDGVMFPFENKSEGMAPFPITMKVESVAVNSGLSDDTFKVEE